MANIDSMAFYNPQGLSKSWGQAELFAGKNGRIATMQDIASSRINQEMDAVAWNSYFTTSSSEYYGLSKSGTPLVVVAHGVGPLSTISGCEEAYDTKNNYSHPNGRITNEQFLQLIDGYWGAVNIVDWNEYLQSKSGNYIRDLSHEEAIVDKWFIARAGTEALAIEYLDKLFQASMNENQQDKNAPIIICDTGSQCNYFNTDTSTVSHLAKLNGAMIHGYAEANLLSIGGLSNTSFSGFRGTSLVTDISTHAFNNGTRFVGVKNDCSDIHPGFDFRKVMNKFRDLISVENNEIENFYSIMVINGEMFTQYPKVGTSLNSGTPKSKVIKHTLIGEVVHIEVLNSYNHGLYKYDEAEIIKHAPEGANAYEMEYPGCFQFMKVEVENSSRILKKDEIYNNSDLLIQLALLD